LHTSGRGDASRDQAPGHGDKAAGTFCILEIKASTFTRSAYGKYLSAPHQPYLKNSIRILLNSSDRSNCGQRCVVKSLIEGSSLTMVILLQSAMDFKRLDRISTSPRVCCAGRERNYHSVAEKSGRRTVFAASFVDLSAVQA
jgi:hypothetical protein